ncbi:dihydrodipicolinate synthase family protein [Oscillospiraceae bacterium Marseille-Q3528]|nr:dihydrodipicolinate synthase family protein [Oscillospiraceae bacterium Marseille-Q3528]
MKKSIVFKGVYPALITPFKADGSMDLEGLKANVKYYMSVGCAGVAFSGSSGEHAFLTREERIAGIKACKEVIGDGKIIAGAGAQTTAATKDLVQDAKDAGADAALVLSPIGNTDNDGMVAHFTELAKVGIPMVLYNHPAATGINIDLELFERLIAIPEVVGMKETSGSLPLAASILRKYSADDITLFTGCDDLTLPAFCVGFQAIILATANVAPKQVIEMMNLVNEGKIKEAQKIYWNLAPLTATIGDENKFPALLKKAVELLGMPAGDPRMPVLPATAEETARVEEGLKIAGLK